MTREAVQSQDGPAVARLQTVMRQVGRLGKLVDSLLDISRLTAHKLKLELEPLDLSAAVHEVTERFQGESKRAGSELRMHSGEPVVVHCDRLRVEQVVVNLVSNALKYGAGKPVDVFVSSEGPWAVLKVCDHGIGIRPEDLDRIFDRFERAVSERHYGGFGLGLWIVRQIVEAMGGAIEVQSTPGQGAFFTVRLPRSLGLADRPQASEVRPH